MSDQVPAICRIVKYTLNDIDVRRINEQRAYSAGHPSELRGNTVVAGDVFPLIIIRTWGDTSTSAVNGQLLLDGNDTLWLTSVTCGDGQGQFTWPERV